MNVSITKQLCPHCNHPYSLKALYCENCGQAVPTADNKAPIPHHNSEPAPQPYRATQPASPFPFPIAPTQPFKREHTFRTRGKIVVISAVLFIGLLGLFTGVAYELGRIGFPDPGPPSTPTPSGTQVQPSYPYPVQDPALPIPLFCDNPCLAKPDFFVSVNSITVDQPGEITLKLQFIFAGQDNGPSQLVLISETLAKSDMSSTGYSSCGLTQCQVQIKGPDGNLQLEPLKFKNIDTSPGSEYQFSMTIQFDGEQLSYIPVFIDF